jgi:hypothetical protein
MDSGLLKKCADLVSGFGKEAGMDWLKLNDQGWAALEVGGKRHFEIELLDEIGGDPVLMLTCDVCQLPLDAPSDFYLTILQNALPLFAKTGLALGLAQDGQTLLLSGAFPAEDLDLEQFGSSATGILVTAEKLEISLGSRAVESGDPSRQSKDSDTAGETDPLSVFSNLV